MTSAEDALVRPDELDAAPDRPRARVASLLAALSAGEAWWFGMPLVSAVLAPAVIGIITTARG